jgi:hypothetical protein
MPMHDNKKVALLIVNALKKEKDPSEDEYKDESREDSSDDSSDDSKMDTEIAMEKFMRAIKESDAKMAAEALQEFNDMCSGGSEYVSSKPEED